MVVTRLVSFDGQGKGRLVSGVPLFKKMKKRLKEIKQRFVAIPFTLFKNRSIAV